MFSTSKSQKEEPLDPAQEFEARLLKRNEPMHEATKPGDSDVQKFYNGATVFVTGGSGFLGKQLIEKLLRATNVAKLFILMRTKKGIPIIQRLNKMLEDPVYDLLRELQPGFEQKIVPVEGDITELRLGLSDEDWKMVTGQTDIIFHMAATTRFDETLLTATISNLRGTREALQLGKECRKIRSFVYISTTYSQAKDHLIKTEVLEDFYPSPIDPEAMIRMAETLEEQKLNDITKRLAEYLLVHEGASEDMPVCVVKPGIVIAAMREPNPGWLDFSSVYGSSGIALGVGMGLMHVIFANNDTRVGAIPVDYANNAAIVAGYETARRRDNGDTKAKVYTVLSSTRTDVTWGHFTGGFVRTPIECSTPSLVWYNYWITTQNPVLFWILSWLLHIIPAYFIDGVCWILGKERRFVKLYTKMYKQSKLLSYFALNDWVFEDKNLAALFDALSPTDKEIFYFDVETIDWEEFLLIYGIGVRKFIIKDGLTGSRYAEKKRLMLTFLHYIVMPLYFFVLYKVLCLGILFISLLLNVFM